MRRILGPLVLFALAIAAPALASSHREAPSAVSTLDLDALPVRNLDLYTFFQDVHAITPEVSGFVNSVGGSVVGIGAQYSQRFNPSSPFGWTIGGGYGIGSVEFEGGTPTVFTDKVSFTTLYGNAGISGTVPIYGRFQGYGAGRLFYSSTKGNFEQSGGGGPSFDEDGEPFNVFGVDKSLGCRYQFNDKLAWFGEHYSQIGWGSGEDGPGKITETVKYGCYRGGLSIGF